VCLAFVHHQRPNLIDVVPQINFQGKKEAAENLLEKSPLGHLPGVLEVVTLKQWSGNSGVTIVESPSAQLQSLKY
jgi:hypothetical protein